MFENFERRNEDFYRAVEDFQRKGCTGRRRLSRGCAVRRALTSQAPSFYLTREHAWKQLLQRRRSRIPPREKPHRSAMWAELERALKRRLEQVPGEDPWVALDHVLTHYRPSRFFLSEDYALRLVRSIERHRLKRHTPATASTTTTSSTPHTDQP